MQTFKIKDEFLVDGIPTKIISGAIHYFRIPLLNGSTVYII